MMAMRRTAGNVVKGLRVGSAGQGEPKRSRGERRLVKGSWGDESGEEEAGAKEAVLWWRGKRKGKAQMRGSRRECVRQA